MVSLFYSTMSLRRFGCVRSCWQVRNLEYLTPSKLKTMRQIQLPVPHMDWPLCTRQKSAWKPSDWLNKLHRYSCDILGQLCQWYLLRNRIQFYKTVLRGCNVWMYDEYSLIFYSVRQSVCWLVHHTFYGACMHCYKPCAYLKTCPHMLTTIIIMYWWTILSGKCLV